ncbi:MAG TPA: hypothetical protein VN089_07660 [Duganella sp.]|nr:hypothetical protein [Duganella sp.]
MTHYAIVETATGKIVRMHSHYVFGNEQPVTCSDEELRAALADLGDPARFEIHAVPADFDPGDRQKTLQFDPALKHLRVAARAPRQSGKGGI